MGRQQAFPYAHIFSENINLDHSGWEGALSEPPVRASDLIQTLFM